MNRLKRKLAERQRVLGCIQMTASADVTEILAGAGFDFIMLDHEHGLAGMGDVVGQLRALAGSSTDALVRVPSNDARYVSRLLDRGVTSVLFPAVSAADEARAAVTACRYPPAGARGAGGGLRATSFDRDPAYYGRANDDVLVAIQIETAAGVDAIPAIAEMEGIDLVIIGPRDLSASIGKLNQFDDPDVRALFERAERGVLDAGLAMGTVIYPGFTARGMFERGHSVILAATDVAFLSRAARAAVDDAR